MQEEEEEIPDDMIPMEPIIPPEEDLTLGVRIYEFVDEHGDKVLGILFTVLLLAVRRPAR